jgi:hypothetical protein
MNFGSNIQALMGQQGTSQGVRSSGLGGLLGGNKGAAQQMKPIQSTPTPNVPQAGQGFFQPQDQAGKAALLQAMIARSRAGHGG